MDWSLWIGISITKEASIDHNANDTRHSGTVAVRNMMRQELGTAIQSIFEEFINLTGKI
jgi:hypothetical protein